MYINTSIYIIYIIYLRVSLESGLSGIFGVLFVADLLNIIAHIIPQARALALNFLRPDFVLNLVDLVHYLIRLLCYSYDFC